VEEKGIEALIILTIDQCEFCERFINNIIMQEFAGTTGFSPDFKIFIINAMENDLPEEYEMYSVPQIMFSPKAKELYRPIIWKTKDHNLKDLRKFLHVNSKVFPKIDNFVNK
jgi:thioredoxin-related protein